MEQLRNQMHVCYCEFIRLSLCGLVSAVVAADDGAAEATASVTEASVLAPRVCICHLLAGHPYASCTHKGKGTREKTGRRNEPAKKLVTMGGEYLKNTSFAEASKNSVVGFLSTYADSTKHDPSCVSPLLAGLDFGSFVAKEFQAHKACLLKWTRNAEHAAAARQPRADPELSHGSGSGNLSDSTSLDKAMSAVVETFLPVLSSGGVIFGELLLKQYREGGGALHVDHDSRLTEVFLKAFQMELPTAMIMTPRNKPCFLCRSSYEQWVHQLAVAHADNFDVDAGYQDNDKDAYDADSNSEPDEDGLASGNAPAAKDEDAIPRALLHQAAVMINGIARSRHSSNLARSTVASPHDLTAASVEAYVGEGLLAACETMVTHHLKTRQENAVHGKRQFRAGNLLGEIIVYASNLDRKKQPMPPPTISAVAIVTRVLTGSNKLNNFLASFCCSAGSTYAASVEWTWAAIMESPELRGDWIQGFFSGLMSIHRDNVDVNTADHTVVQTGGLHDTLVGIVGRISASASSYLGPALPFVWPLSTTAAKVPETLKQIWGARQSPAPLGGLYAGVPPHESFEGLQPGGVYDEAIEDVLDEIDTYIVQMEHGDIKCQAATVAFAQGYAEVGPAQDDFNHAWVTTAPAGGKATDPDTTLHSLRQNCKTLDEFKQACAMLGMDGGDCIHTVRLVWADDVFNSRFIGWPGGLHVGMIFCKLLGKAGGVHNGCSEWWLAAGVASVRTIARAHEGKDYVRARRLWLCTQRAILKLQRDTYHSENTAGKELWEGVTDNMSIYVEANRPELGKGVSVEIHGLATQGDLNGSVATVTSKQISAKGFWRVAVVTSTDDGRERRAYCVRPGNLRVVSPPSSYQLREKLPAELTAAIDEHAAAFQAWSTEKAKVCAMFQYWNNIIEMIQLFILLILNTRCTQGNFATIQVRVALLTKMLACCHAYDLTIYCRILSAHIAQVKRSHQTHPTLWSQWNDDQDYGYHAPGSARIELDHCLEMWGVREMKRCLKTLARNVCSPEHFRAHMMSSAVKASFVRSAMVYSDQESIVTRQYTKQAEVLMTAKLYAQLLTYTNPFSVASTQSNGEDLWNVATQALAPRKAVPQILGAFLLGVEQREAFKARLEDGKLFWDTPIKRNNLPTLGPASKVKRKIKSGSRSLASTSAVLYEIMTRALNDPDRDWTAEKLLPWSLIELPRLKADECGHALLEDAKVDLVAPLKKAHRDFGTVAARVVDLCKDVPVAICVDLGQTFQRQSHDPDNKLKTCGGFVNRVIASPINQALSRTVDISKGRLDLYLCGELHPDSLLSAPAADGGPLVETPVAAPRTTAPESAYVKCKCAKNDQRHDVVLLCDGPCEGEFALCCLDLSSVPDSDVWHCPECKESLHSAAADAGAKFSPRNVKIGTHVKRIGSQKLPVEYAKIFSDLKLNGSKLGDILRSTHNKVLFNRLLIDKLVADEDGRVLKFLQAARGGSVHVTCLDQAFRLHLSAAGRVTRSEEPKLQNNLPEADHRLDTCALHFAASVPDDSGWQCVADGFERNVGSGATETRATRPMEMYRGVLFKLVEDTDCLCSATSLNDRMQHLAHGSFFGKSGAIIVCDVHAMSDALGPLAARAFRALHILSGNDEIAKTRTKGKKTWHAILLKLCAEEDECIREGLLKLGTRDWTDLQMREPEFLDMVKHLTTLYLRLFGVEKTNSQVKTLTDCRIWQYTRGQGKKKDLADLVETDNQWLWHCLRANFSAYVWTCAASLPPLRAPNPTGRGWSTRMDRETGKLVLVPRWSSEPALPPSLANIFSCMTCGQSAQKKAEKANDGSQPSAGCVTNRCVCHARGQKCTHLCGCVNCANPNGINDTTVTFSMATGAVEGPAPPQFVRQPGTETSAEDEQLISDLVAVEYVTLDEELSELDGADGGDDAEEEEDTGHDADAPDGETRDELDNA